MKIPFTLQPLLHTKGRGRKKENKKKRKMLLFLLPDHEAQSHTIEDVWLVLNQDAQHAVDTQLNDVTTVLINPHLNLLPLKGAIIRVSTNP